MIQDKIVFGGFVGLLAKVAMEFVQVPLWRYRVVSHPLAHYAASIFIDINAIHHTLNGTIVALLADYIYGIFFGIVFVYLLELIGRRHIIYKSLLFGAFLWFFSFGGLRSLPMVQLREVIPTQMLYYLLFHVIYGLALGFSIKALGKYHYHEAL